MTQRKTRISSDGDNGFIEVGDLSGVDSEGTTDVGIFLRGDGLYLKLEHIIIILLN